MNYFHKLYNIHLANFALIFDIFFVIITKENGL